MRWCGKALSAASIAGVVLLAMAMMLFAPGAAIAGQSGMGTWHPDPADPAALSRLYDTTARAMHRAGAPYSGWAAESSIQSTTAQSTTPSGNSSNGDTPRQFLGFDARDNGRVIEVFGDLASADRIAVLVPGVATRADNYNTGLGDILVRAPAVQARALYHAARAASPGQHVAVIAWLGYDAPQGVGRTAAREELARAGASSLVQFTSQLAVMRPTAGVTVIGHSYGSVVAGLAAATLPHQVKNIVVIGSPGMGVSQASDLHSSARIWAGQSDQDWIDWVPAFQMWGAGHGTMPTTPGFGDIVFGTQGVTDHDHYLSPGTQSLTNIVDIVLGHDAQVTGPGTSWPSGQASG